MNTAMRCLFLICMSWFHVVIGYAGDVSTEPCHGYKLAASLHDDEEIMEESVIMSDSGDCACFVIQNQDRQRVVIGEYQSEVYDFIDDLRVYSEGDWSFIGHQGNDSFVISPHGEEGPFQEAYSNYSWLQRVRDDEGERVIFQGCLGPAHEHVLFLNSSGDTILNYTVIVPGTPYLITQ
jgi:hypothetical protein